MQETNNRKTKSAREVLNEYRQSGKREFRDLDIKLDFLLTIFILFWIIFYYSYLIFLICFYYHCQCY